MTRVLIVDDDQDHAESLADVLDMRGHQTELAFSGEEALELVRARDFDFVLLDVKLPGINGVDTFLELKTIRPGAKVMMMTGFSVEQLVAQAIEAGALGVLYKPFATVKLLETLSEQVKQRGRVLVVDDDPDFVDSIVPTLEGANYEVCVAETGAEALEKLKHEQIDCLLLDLRLPVLSGPELYARLVETGRAVPTVLVTGGNDDAQPGDRLKPQLNGMLFKPFDPNVLLAAISSAVERSQAA